MSKLNGQKWINSKELLNTCEISRATLNNYIKLGIVPKPVVKSPEEGLEGTRKIGYFPAEVLGVIEQVKRLKSEGKSIGQIAGTVNAGAAEKTTEGEPGSKGLPAQESVESRQSDRDKRGTGNGLQKKGNRLNLTLEDVHTPAYLLNYEFEIEWINEEAEERIFGKNIKSVRDVELRNVFRLFLTWDFNNFMVNWEEILDYHMSFFKAKQGGESISNMFTGISGKEVEYLRKSYDKTKNIPAEKICQRFIALVQKDRGEERYIVYTTFFREGLFFLYLPADNVPEGITDFLSRRESVVRDLMQLRLPTLVSFSVLVADLQSSVRICAELPPEEYFELINDMWKVLETSFVKFNGIFGKRIGDGVVYYFLKKQDPDYVMNSINCALEIRENMGRFSNEWKLRKKWLNDLYLNIGINEGQEYFSTTVPSSTTVEFTALGDTINYASRLSNLARHGAIITTKNLMNQLDEEGRRRLHFGIAKRMHERDVFVEKVFSRVIDLVDNDESRRQRFSDIAALPVTEIIG